MPAIYPAVGDYGSLEVRRPAGIAQTQLWRTMKLGDEVANDLRPLKDWSQVPVCGEEAPDRGK